MSRIMACAKRLVKKGVVLRTLAGRFADHDKECRRQWKAQDGVMPSDPLG